MAKSDRTEDHPGPAPATLPAGREALVVVFPAPRSLPVPIPRDPAGRDWLKEHGAPDTRVSSEHVMFHRVGGGLAIEDLGSRNGTYVEGVRIAPKERVPVEDGARIRIGRTLMVYRDGFIGDDKASPPLGDMVGPFGLRAVAAQLAALARRPQTNVLIEGETGTGKELLARLVADTLGRSRPYGAVNVAGVPAGVFESQMFGYVAGAYSGSGKGSKGLLLDHDGGAVFLDEIGDLPEELQPKLLRFLENREVLAVGASRPSKANVLVIAATLKTLEDEARFRADLLARFSARLELPALRDRSEDLFEILQSLAARAGGKFDVAQVEVESVERLALHDWPKNVRELALRLEEIAAIAPAGTLPLWAVERVLGPRAESRVLGLTEEAVRRALEACGDNETAAARKLGISRGRIRRFLKKA